MAETYEKYLDDVTPAVADSVRLVTSAGNTRKATLSDLAGTMFENDTGVDYNTTAQTVKGAINELEQNKVTVGVSGTTLVIS